VKRISQETDHPLAHDVAWREALERCLGNEALDLDRMAKTRGQSLGGQTMPMGFADFFFQQGDLMHPSISEEDFDDDEFDEDDFDDEIDDHDGLEGFDDTQFDDDKDIPF
jgi:hypothetical protein